MAKMDAERILAVVEEPAIGGWLALYYTCVFCTWGVMLGAHRASVASIATVLAIVLNLRWFRAWTPWSPVVLSTEFYGHWIAAAFCAKCCLHIDAKTSLVVIPGKSLLTGSLFVMFVATIVVVVATTDVRQSRHLTHALVFATIAIGVAAGGVHGHRVHRGLPTESVAAARAVVDPCVMLSLSLGFTYHKHDATSLGLVSHTVLASSILCLAIGQFCACLVHAAVPPESQLARQCRVVLRALWLGVALWLVWMCLFMYGAECVEEGVCKWHGLHFEIFRNDGGNEEMARAYIGNYLIGLVTIVGLFTGLATALSPDGEESRGEPSRRLAAVAMGEETEKLVDESTHRSVGAFSGSEHVCDDSVHVV